MFQEKKFLANERVENIPIQNHPPPLKVNWSTPNLSALNKINPEQKDSWNSWSGEMCRE